MEAWVFVCYMRVFSHVTGMKDFVTPVLSGPGMFEVELKPMQIRTFIIGVV